MALHGIQGVELWGKLIG